MSLKLHLIHSRDSFRLRPGSMVATKQAARGRELPVCVVFDLVVLVVLVVLLWLGSVIPAREK